MPKKKITGRAAKKAKYNKKNHQIQKVGNRSGVFPEVPLTTPKIKKLTREFTIMRKEKAAISIPEEGPGVLRSHHQKGHVHDHAIQQARDFDKWAMVLY